MKLNILQVFRAVAALMVLLVHVRDYFIPVDMELGRYGVDVFFVLSGFMMAYLHQDKIESLTTFAEKRLIRIYPVYLEALAFAVLVYGVGSFDIGANLLFLDYDANHRGERILQVAWTLSYEVWFYAVFAVAMYLFGKKFWKGILIFAILTAVRAGDSFFLSTYNYEFCLGVAISLIGSNFLRKIDQKIKYPPLLILIGDASYSLYLLHQPLIDSLGRFLHKFTSSASLLVNGFWYVMLLASIVAISIANYLFIERKLIKFFRDYFLSSSTLSK